mgnify:CR=1 FL=1
MTQDCVFLTVEDKMNESVFLGRCDMRRPALIIEGTDDMWAYSYLLKQTSFTRTGNVDIVVGSGRERILGYHDEGQLSFEYVILLDADHDRWLNRCRQDERIIYTHYYSVENYFTCTRVIEATVSDFADMFTRNDTAEVIVREVEESLSPIYAAIVMKIENGWCISLERCGIDRWMDSGTGFLDPLKLASYVSDELKKTGVMSGPEPVECCEAITSIDTGNGISLPGIDMVVSGKHKLKAVYYRFKAHFPEIMKHRNLRTFQMDLAKNGHMSEEVASLVAEIESRLGRLLESRASLPVS